LNLRGSGRWAARIRSAMDRGRSRLPCARQGTKARGTTFHAAIGRLPSRKSLGDDLEELGRWAACARCAAGNSLGGRRTAGKVWDLCGAAPAGAGVEETVVEPGVNLVDLEEDVYFTVAAFLDDGSLGHLDVTCQQLRELDRALGGPWYQLRDLDFLSAVPLVDVARSTKHSASLEVEVLANPDCVSLAVVCRVAADWSYVIFDPETGSVQVRKVCETPMRVEVSDIQLLPPANPRRRFQGSMGVRVREGRIAFFRRRCLREEPEVGPLEFTGIEGRRLMACLRFGSAGPYQVRMIYSNL